MISGRQALATIEDAVTRLRADENGLDEALRSASEQGARLRAERMEAFRDLARVRLDAMSGETVVGELDAAERRALELLADRRRSFDQLAGNRSAAEEAVRAAEGERHRRAKTLEDAIAAIEELRASIDAKIHANPEWSAQRQRIDAAIHIADEAEKKAAGAEADREAKGKPYEADPLFMYLWRRRFGTAEYVSRGLVRFLDRKVARLVGFDKARANYTALNEIPQRLREHAARVKAEIGAEQVRLAAVERAEMAKADGEDRAARGGQARIALAEAEGRLGSKRRDLAELDAAHDRIADGESDDAYRQAVDLLAAADSRQDLQELYREAARTPTPKDEAIVRRIEQTEASIGRTEQEIGRLRTQTRQIAQRRTEIERERDNFRRRGYDNPWGRFGNDQVLGQVLGGILGGVISSSVLGNVLSEGYQQRQSPWDQDYGGGLGGGAAGPWGDITGGLWGGGNDSGSFGGASGDGFTTGDTF